MQSPSAAAAPPWRRRLLQMAGLSLVRRAAIVPIGWLAAPDARAQSAVLLSPTPAQTEGPFYPRVLPADRDADLTRIAGHAQAAQGTPLHLTGRVLLRNGAPAMGASVELWQCDAYGRYHHAGDDGLPRDDDFQGFGISPTDAEGRYTFKTIRPVPYGGRPAHLHVRITRNGRAPLTTQLYVDTASAGSDPALAASPTGTFARLSLPLASAPELGAGAVKGSFDFVLR